ncbi:putative membrane protein [Escherichia coli P0299438.10]|nr:hypothetical protein ECBD_0413 [Escherichia coli 'BL21-Gold(DE3)pLysS AG']AEE58618.1 conserved hypothetical protein [Escherichia coli UMNK88]AEJ58731.1 putative membrane protein [Escherichia coli UMNF18]AHM29582.1 membrane protein [Escherichia coli]EHV53818.1 putative membrane protein [Escherichia coli DEC6A]EHV56614.1 putative membrane protein [Escherichia coli DEC6C]EHV67704.1 putative membrane protein [Escherichia coli DEC6D]EHV70656.1 putative membrane protein [Escherichia coli DEC6E]
MLAIPSSIAAFFVNGLLLVAHYFYSYFYSLLKKESFRN